MRHAAAEGAAGADRMMRDAAHDRGEQLAERTVAHRLVERRMAHAGADAELAAVDRDLVQLLDAVDVDEVRRLRQPERHDRHEALPARQHPAVVGRDLRQHRDRFVERLRRVVAKGGGFHRALVLRALGRAPRRRSIFGTFTIFWIQARFSGYVKARRPQATATMKPPPFSYHDPRTVGDAVAPARPPRQRQAARRRAVDDADAQHAVRAARPHHRPQQGRRPRPTSARPTARSRSAR